MKPYIAQAVQELQNSKALKVEIPLQEPNDYKKNVLRLGYNKLLFLLQTRMIHSHLKNALLRTTGMKVGLDVCILHYIRFDPNFPELITLGNGCLVGGLCHLITHKVQGKKLILGKVDVGDRVLLGGDVTMQPGSRVNKKAMVMLFSELSGEVPEGELWGGKPAQLFKKFDNAELEKFFKPSNGQHKEYYGAFQRKVKAFLQD